MARSKAGLEAKSTTTQSTIAAVARSLQTPLATGILEVFASWAFAIRLEGQQNVFMDNVYVKKDIVAPPLGFAL